MKMFAICAHLACCFYLSTVAGGADPIDPGQFGKLHTLIEPAESERHWEQLPWVLDLWEARKIAAKEGKPVLLWEREGHTLGCV